MTYRHLIVVFLTGIVWSATPAVAADLQKPLIVEKYSGGFKDDYLQELSRVKTYASLAQQNISTQLGLIQYGAGFYHPISIRFDDGAPAIHQTPYFYVQKKSGVQEYEQELIVNVEAYARHRREVEGKDGALKEGFYYAMAQLMFNDLAGGQTDKTLPVWVQEGLAVYVAGNGEAIVREVAEKLPSSRVNEFVEELNYPFPYLSKRQWAQDYLAIKYIFETGGVNALQGFVRHLVNGKSAADAVLDVLSQDWLTFKNNVKSFSAKTYLQFAPKETGT